MPTAVIAGAGIAGLTAALALARAGWHITVCEQAPELGEVGAGLQLSPNACRVLDWLGILPSIGARAFEPEAAVLRDGLTGGAIFRAPLREAAERRWRGPYLHVHRADLLAVLAEEARLAGIQIRLGEAVTHARTEDNTGHLHLDSGETIRGDLVLGADGIRSALAASVEARPAPQFSGQVAWRAVVPANRMVPGTISPDATVWAGAGRHLVTYYLRGGELVNLVAVVERADWAEEGWSVPGNPDALRAAFRGWHPALQTLLAEVEDCHLWGLFTRPGPARWTRGRIALTGDAAHPMLPFMAQGAAQAIEDAAALVRHLGGTQAPQALAPQALAAWEAERRPRTARIIRTAEANGQMFHRAPGPLRLASRTAMRLATRLAPGVAAGRLDWLYGFDAIRGS